MSKGELPGVIKIVAAINALERTFPTEASGWQEGQEDASPMLPLMPIETRRARLDKDVNDAAS